MQEVNEDNFDEQDARAVFEEWQSQLDKAERRRSGYRYDAKFKNIMTRIHRAEERGSIPVALARVPWWHHFINQRVTRVAAVIMLAMLCFAGWKIRSLTEQLEQLRIDIAISGIDTAATPTGFSVTPTNSLKLEGSFDPRYIAEVKFRFGNEPAGQFLSLDSSAQRADPRTGRVSFEKESPPFPGNNQTIVSELKFVPRGEIADKFPQYFTVEHMTRSQSFYLRTGRIEPLVVNVGINRPGDQDRVTKMEDLEGNIRGGFPVIVVQPQAGEKSWHIQDPPEVSGDAFGGRVYFGDDRTPAETEFRVVVFVVPSEDEAKRKFPAKQTIQSLPPGYPRSHPITVIRK